MLNNAIEAGFILRPGHLLDPAAISAACGSIKIYLSQYQTERQTGAATSFFKASVCNHCQTRNVNFVDAKVKTTK